MSSKSRMAFEASWEIVLKLWPELEEARVAGGCMLLFTNRYLVQMSRTYFYIRKRELTMAS